jgi:hypothetical protein
VRVGVVKQMGRPSTRIDLACPATREIRPRRSSPTTIWWIDGGVVPKCA